MSTISPALADAFRLLRGDLYAHLCEADFLASKFGEWSEADADAARRLIPDLVTVIRGVLVEHEPQPGGMCRTCASTYPCAVVTTIHALVKDPEREFIAIVRRANDNN